MKKICAAIAICFFLLSCGEQRSAQYASAPDAISSKDAKGGWVPIWLPIESQQIQIEYNIDTNEIWLRFKLPPEGRIHLEKHMKKLSDEEIQKVPFQRRRGVTWWPEGLIQQQPANDGALNAVVYIGIDNVVPTNAYIAFERNSNYVYSWQHRNY
jgi:hypothetical protein